MGFRKSSISIPFVGGGKGRMQRFLGASSVASISLLRSLILKYWSVDIAFSSGMFRGMRALFCDPKKLIIDCI